MSNSVLLSRPSGAHHVNGRSFIVSAVRGVLRTYLSAGSPGMPFFLRGSRRPLTDPYWSRPLVRPAPCTHNWRTELRGILDPVV